MDRNDKSKLMMKTRSFSEAVAKLCTDYSDFLSDLESSEQDKIDNIPDGLTNSSLTDKLEQGIESIQQANETVEQISDLIAEIPDTLNITMRRAAKQHCICTQSCDINLPVKNREKKTERLQIVITASLNKALRYVSEVRQISMNEIINTLLAANLHDIVNC